MARKGRQLEALEREPNRSCFKGSRAAAEAEATEEVSPAHATPSKRKGMTGNGGRAREVGQARGVTWHKNDVSDTRLINDFLGFTDSETYVADSYGASLPSSAARRVTRAVRAVHM
jgi:hypothetical protein